MKRIKELFQNGDIAGLGAAFILALAFIWLIGFIGYLYVDAINSLLYAK